MSWPSTGSRRFSNGSPIEMTALMAIARKVIVFDFKELSYEYGLALGVAHWLISKKNGG